MDKTYYLLITFILGFVGLITFQKTRRPQATPQRPISVLLSNVNDELGVTTNIGKQHGLLGEYFNAWPPPEGRADFIRIDDNINFAWPGDAPIGTPIIPDDDFSERWTGFIDIPATGNWTFTTLSDDGVRLWINAATVIDNWTVHGLTEDNGTIFLNQGKYPFKLEHFNKFYSLTDDPGITTIKLFYAGPSQPKIIVPRSAFNVNSSTLPNAREWTGADGRRYKFKVVSVRRFDE